MSSVIGVLLYGVVAVLAWLLLREFRYAMRSIRALRWRRVEGRIVEKGSEASGADSEELQYAYSVEAEDYRSDVVGFGLPGFAQKLLAGGVIRETLSDAPAVTVFYDPRNPVDSSLIAGFQGFHGLRIGVCAVVLLVAYAATL